MGRSHQFSMIKTTNKFLQTAVLDSGFLILVQLLSGENALKE